MKCHSLIWIKCKWQQRFCATELSVHESSAFVSNYEHIFLFQDFFSSTSCSKYDGQSSTHIFLSSKNRPTVFHSMKHSKFFLKHCTETQNRWSNVPFLDSLKTSNFRLHLTFSRGIKTRHIAYFEHTELVSVLITFTKHFLAGTPLTPWTEWHPSMHLL